METRREHLGELQVYLGFSGLWQGLPDDGPDRFQRIDRHRPWETIVGAMVAYLRQNSILLPSAAVLEKIALVARARARKQAYEELTAGVDHAVRESSTR